MKKIIIIFVVMLSFVASLAALTLGDVLDKAAIETTGFGAKMKMTMTTADSKKMTVAMQLYVKGKYTRLDTTLTQASFPDSKSYQQVKLYGVDQSRTIIFLNGNKYDVTAIYPRNEAYIVRTIKSDSPEAAQLSTFDKSYDDNIEKVGEEDFAGIKCDKYKKILDEKEKKQLKEVFVYINPANKTYVGQIATMNDGGVQLMEMSGYEFTVSDDVFKVPSGYQKYKDEQEMVMDIMKDMQGG